MEMYEGKICVSFDDLVPGVLSKSNYDYHVRRGNINVMRQGKGLGNYALVEYDSLPERFRLRFERLHGGHPSSLIEQDTVKRCSIDPSARAYYSAYRLADGSPLELDKVEEYSINASVMAHTEQRLDEMRRLRKVGHNVRTAANDVWTCYAGEYEALRSELGHTLPRSIASLKNKLCAWRKEGYESLVSKKLGNQNTRKVSMPVERLILSLDSLPERPFNSTVSELYNDFVRGRLDVIDPTTGELFDPAAFCDADGYPLTLSDTTIANYLNNPKNKALRSKIHDGQWEYNNAYRPHHLRKSPLYSFSKVSMDDRDLPRKMTNGQRVKAYYAYDVASGCVVGYSYARLKTADLFLDCVRNMFRTIHNNAWNMPAEVEVEHHLVRDFADGLMQAGEVFPFVRWCNPGNSQEKRAEHLNRAKKYGVEKRSQQGIGRWYSRLEANRPKQDKVYDELNNTYKEKQYSYDELVADDIRSINEFNHGLHPLQKLYPGMTRWEVLCQNQNPDLKPLDRATITRYLGECTQTSIRRNMYCTVQYAQYCLPSPELIGKLQPRNYKVDAYWMPSEDGGAAQSIYIYQNGKYIAECAQIERYQEAKAEQTEADLAAYQRQSAYVARYDKMIKDGKIQRVVVMPHEDSQAAAAVVAKPIAQAVDVDPLTDIDLSDYLDIAHTAKRAAQDI